MIVRLTTAQRVACCNHGADPHTPWLNQGVLVGKQSWDVEMPPIGWRTLLERLSEVAYSPYGRRSKRIPGSAHRAIKRIALRLAWLEAHPAFNGAALPGESHDVFLGWYAEFDGYSPYPRPGRPGDLLAPHWLTVGGVRVTRWRPELPIHRGRLLDPDEHYAFIDGAGRSSATRRSSLDH